MGLVLMPRTPGSSEPALPAEHGVALEDIGTDPVDVAVAKVHVEYPPARLEVLGARHGVGLQVGLDRRDHERRGWGGGERRAGA